MLISEKSINAYRCIHCGSEKSHTRLPSRWKEWPAGEFSCGKCWSSKFSLRAVTLAVSGPATNGDPTEMQAAWKDLRERLTASWAAVGRLANWSMMQLLRADEFRRADQESISDRPDVYLYGLFGKYPDRSDWVGGASLAQAVMRSVEQDWRSDRYSVLWEASRSPRTYRFPSPLPVPAQNWSCELNGHGVATVSMGCPGGRINVRLVNDRTAMYQRDRLRMLASGEVRAGEAAIYAVPSNGPTRGGMTIRARRGRDRMPFRVMVKLIGYFPKRERAEQERSGIMRIQTGAMSLLVAEQEGHTPWRLNGDDVHSRVVGHLAALQRARDDVKQERRLAGGHRERMGRDMTAMCERHQRWRKSTLDRLSAEIANLAERRGVETVEWDDTVRDFLPSFSWYELREVYVRRKLSERGIDLIASGQVVDENPGTAREEEV